MPFGWGRACFLLADVYQALTGEQHPSRPTSSTKTTSGASRPSELRARLKAQRDRFTKTAS